MTYVLTCAEHSCDDPTVVTSTLHETVSVSRLLWRYKEMASLVISIRKVRVLQTELPEAFLLSIRPELIKGS